MKFLFILLFFITANAEAVFRDILDVSTQTADSTSTVDTLKRIGVIEKDSDTYSVQCNMTGATFNVDVVVQASLDNVSWVTVSTTNVSAASPILINNAGVRHRFVRVFIDYTSGTYGAHCHLND